MWDRHIGFQDQQLLPTPPTDIISQVPPFKSNTYYSQMDTQVYNQHHPILYIPAHLKIPEWFQ
jgi:hypothetical protein